jgi:ATP-dependent Lon protease
MDSAAQELTTLKQSVENSTAPTKLKEIILLRLDQLAKLTSSPAFLPEFDRINRYIEWVVSIPWNKKTQDTLDLKRAKEILDRNHYGLDDVKERILEYISVMILRRERSEEKEPDRAPILCFVGLVGTGKTTIAASIAQSLGRKFARIPFGGMGDPLDLRGQSRMHPEAEPGKIVKALKATQSKNPVILLDEIDRVTESGRASIMGVLLELLDPEQNHEFMDHYIDYPIDLSEVLFIATANNTTNISTAVLDRLEPISMPSYSDMEKITIGRDYMLPKILKASGVPKEALVIEEDVWPLIVRPLGFDAGTRTLERSIEGIVRKVARMIVEGRGQTFKINTHNVKEFLPQ